MNSALGKSFLAVVASLLLAAPPGAQGVSLDSDGIGQALIYPYYTAQSVDGNPFNTFLTVVNSGSYSKALRVRFREARYGAPVLSFNLFLGPYDSWAAAVVPFGGGAQLLTADLSCADPGFADFAVSSVPFKFFSSAAYQGDGAGDGIERTLEGFVEILEMATLTGDSRAATFVAGGPAGRPGNCDLLRDSAKVTTAPPNGMLSGTLTLINVASGMDFTVRADALSELASRPYYRPGSDPYPDFNAAEIDNVSTFLADGSFYRSVWSRPVDAVSAVLMRTYWIGEYILDTATQSRTDVVVTFPTRSFYVTPFTADAPFTLGGAATPTCPGRAWSALGIDYFNREERFANPRDPDLGIPLGPIPTICAASTVLSIINPGASHMPAPGTSGVLGASSTRFVNVISGVQNGWFRASTGGSPLVSGAASMRAYLATGGSALGAHTYYGVPVVGFTVRTFRNGTLQCPAGSCQGNYGGAYPLRFQREVSPSGL